MRDTGSEGGVKRIEVERDVHESVRGQVRVENVLHLAAVRREVLGVDRLGVEPLHLVALVRRGSADADLQEPVTELGVRGLHDSRKRRRVRVRVALEGVVNVGVGIKVQDADRAVVVLPQRLDQGKSDRVVASQRQWNLTSLESCASVHSKQIVRTPVIVVATRSSVRESRTGICSQ